MGETESNAGDPEIVYLPIAEFRDRGYLQEVNRRVLHPLGLALEVSTVPLLDALDLLDAIKVEFRTIAASPEQTDVYAAAVGRAVTSQLAEQMGVERISGVWDYRGDPDGIRYVLSPEDAAAAIERAIAVDREFGERAPRREAALGFVIQPMNRFVPDPMDTPPADHGSDRFDYVEITYPAGIDEPPLPFWLTPDWAPCQDCRANAFLRWAEPIGDASSRLNAGHWVLTVAHSDTCPTLAQREKWPPLVDSMKLVTPANDVLHRMNGCSTGGPLHVIVDDDNCDDHSVQWCRENLDAWMAEWWDPKYEGDPPPIAATADEVKAQAIVILDLLDPLTELQRVVALHLGREISPPQYPPPWPIEQIIGWDTDEDGTDG